MIWRIAPLAGLLALAACHNPGSDQFETQVSHAGQLISVWGAAEVLSVVNTKKTLVDHVATWVSGRDCSAVRAEREGVWCVDWPSPPPPPQQVYCYSSWARPSCYSQPYTQGNDRLIGFVPAPLPIR